MLGIDAVYYTHLDVYKRQDKGVYQLQDKYITISEEELREYLKSL